MPTTKNELHQVSIVSVPCADKHYLTPIQAARALQVDIKTVYRGIHDGRIPSVKVRCSYRIPRAFVFPENCKA